MQLTLALMIGALYAAGVFLILRRSLVRVALGLVVLGHAANLLIFVAGGVGHHGPPIHGHDQTLLAAETMDPLPQALVLTAIVIGFAVLAFVLALAHRAERELGTDDIDELESSA